jgi:hypothetical protein
MSTASPTPVAVWLDRIAVALLVLGVLCMVQPWWKFGFQLGFWLTLAGIVATNITARLPRGGR